MPQRGLQDTATRGRSSLAELKKQLDLRTRELLEAQERQVATSDVLNVIKRSGSQPKPVFDTIVGIAARLCQAEYAIIFRLEGERFRLAASNNTDANYIKFIERSPPKLDRGSISGRVVLDRATVHIPDVRDDPEYNRRKAQSIGNYRTLLGVPLLREGEPVGVIVMVRTEARPYTDAQIALVTTFADQAVIAIENARLFREMERARNRLIDALENTSEGFAFYDSTDRLELCNTRYKDLLYPGLSIDIAEGMTFEEIIRGAATSGLIPQARGRIEEWVAERLEQHRNPAEPRLQQRSDGRSILISEHRTGQGGTVAVYSDITELKQRERELAEKSNALEQLSSQLAKYLSPQVYESIFTGRQEVKVASHRKKLTVFFSDIAGFTETADRLESEELTLLLNQYLTEMSRIALDHGATIDKYVGDAIIIFFGDPESQGVKEDALACVQMAISMRDRMRDLEAVWRDSGIERPLKCRIGINTGFCTVGNFGSEDRMDYTIIGGGVNLASRLEKAATPGEILVSYETYALVKDKIDCQEHGEMTVKGIAYPVATYRVIDSHAELDKRPGRIREDHPNLKLNVDLEAMSEQERSEAAIVLRSALDRILESD